MDKSKIKIMICCHKKTSLPNDDIFLPIHVGAKSSKLILDMQRDDQMDGLVCDNISEKNFCYCETTALYWAWKNIRKIYPNLEYIGLNHYRRYFSFDEKKLFTVEIIKKEDELINYSINEDKLHKYLKKGYILQSSKQEYPCSVYMEYRQSHISDDIRILKKVVHDLYPDYDNAFYESLIKNNTFAPFNIFLMPMADFEEYCKWLFDILFECEKRIDISNYNNYQKRIWGFFAERLYNVWIYKNKKKTKCLNTLRYDNGRKNHKFLRQLLLTIRNKCSFFFLNFGYRYSDFDDTEYFKLIGQS